MLALTIYAPREPITTPTGGWKQLHPRPQIRGLAFCQDDWSPRCVFHYNLASDLIRARAKVHVLGVVDLRYRTGRQNLVIAAINHLASLPHVQQPIMTSLSRGARCWPLQLSLM